MFAGLILEWKYTSFILDQKFKNNLQALTKKVSVGLRILYYLIIPFYLIYFVIDYILMMTVIILSYLIIYTFIGFAAVLIVIIYISLDSTISTEWIVFISAIIGLIGTVLTLSQNRKQFIDEQRANAYKELTQSLIGIINNNFINRKPFNTTEQLEKYISLSSNKVLSLFREIIIKSKSLNKHSTKNDIKNVIEYSLFLIDFMRYEVNLNRDTGLGTKFDYKSLTDLICYDFYHEKKEQVVIARSGKKYKFSFTEANIQATLYIKIKK